jgi:hypothetical protein
MPCRSYDDDLPSRNTRSDEDQKTIDEMARRLCTVMSKFKENDPKAYAKLDKPTRNWHRNHIAADIKAKLEEERSRAYEIKEKAEIAERKRHNWVEDKTRSKELGKMVVHCTKTNEERILD